MSMVLKSVQDGTAIVTLNRPEKRNALTPEMAGLLARTLESAAEEANVILLQGAGKSFCAGADLNSVNALTSENDIRAHAEATGALFHTLGNLPVPVIAVVTGHALGAGCGLVTLCDMAVAAPDAKLGYPEIGHGILPALVTPPLVRAVGKRRAFQILTRKTPLNAREALETGLIAEIAVDPDAVAQEIARHLATAAPGQVAAFKALLTLCASAPDEESDRAALKANIADRLLRTRRASEPEN